MKKLLIAVPLAFLVGCKPPFCWLAVILLGLVAVNLVAAALWPDRVARCRLVVDRFPLRSLLVGLFVLLVQVWLVQTLPLKPLLLLASLILDLGWLAQGLPAVAGRLGQGLSLSGQAATAGGTALLGLVWGLPVLGWLTGIGLGLTALGAAVQKG